jgi:hypothetical protein
MTQERKPSGWWQSVPGVLTAVAAVVAAVSGLIGGLNQIGVFDRLKSPPTAASAAARTTTRDSASGAIAASGAARVLRQPAGQPAEGLEPSRHRQVGASGKTPPTPGASVARRDTSGRTVAERAPRPAPPDTASNATPGGVGKRAPQQGAAPSGTADSAAAAPAPLSGTLPAGTVLELASATRVCSTTHQEGDRVPATVVVPVSGATRVLLPVGTPVVLRVVRLKPPLFISARTDSVVVPGRSYPLPSGNARVQRELVAGAGEAGLGVGACVPVGGRITVTLTEPVTLGGS